MSLVRLVYFSSASREMSLSDIKDILTTARSNNKAIGVCGMLCYDNQFFLQAIEGDRKVISELFIKISEDHRHQDVVIVSFSEIKDPLFEDWKMGYASSNQLLNEMVTKLDMTSFDPEKLTAIQCLAILKSLSRQQTEA
jgi:hypothetical protein